MAGKIPVIECFGPTIQGEGMVIGRKTMFVRTAGCDYACSWCDSAFTWNGMEKGNIKMMTPEDVVNNLLDLGGDNFNHVTISGGNPALIGQPMSELIDLLHAKGIAVGLETQGSRYQPWFTKIDDLTISPKPPSSLMKTDFNILDDIISKLLSHGTNFSLKIVVFNDKDFEYAKDVNIRYLSMRIPFYLSVGNPNSYEEGDISRRLLNSLEWLWEKVMNDKHMNNVLPLPQLHTLVFGNKRKV